MRKISYSQISTYLRCQKLWKHIYKDGFKQPSNEHMEFGTLVHNVLESRIIPDEGQYLHLKETFGITSWEIYFGIIFKELDEMFGHLNEFGTELVVETNMFIGIVDKVYKLDDGDFLLLDYKTTARDKVYEDMKRDKQLYFYAYLFSKVYSVPISRIKIGYINIPKSNVGKPKLLKSGKLSTAKTQNTTYELFYEAIKENNLFPSHYKEYLESLKEFKIVSMVSTYVDVDVVNELLEIIELVMKDMEKGYTLPCHNCDCIKGENK